MEGTYIFALVAADKRKTATADPAVVHADDANTKDGAHDGIGGIAPSLEEVGPDVRADSTLRCDGTERGIIAFRLGRGGHRLCQQGELEPSSGDIPEVSHSACVFDRPE